MMGYSAHALLVDAFAGLAASFKGAVASAKGFGSAVSRSVRSVKRRRKAKFREEVRGKAKRAAQQSPAGTKLAKKAKERRLGITHPTRGTMATSKGLRPFSMRGLPPLTPMFPKPMSTRQWKRKMHADGFRSVPDCRRLPPHGWKPS
jgi:hypothetical protein